MNHNTGIPSYATVLESQHQLINDTVSQVSSDLVDHIVGLLANHKFNVKREFAHGGITEKEIPSMEHICNSPEVKQAIINRIKQQFADAGWPIESMGMSWYQPKDTNYNFAFRFVFEYRI